MQNTIAYAPALPVELLHADAAGRRTVWGHFMAHEANALVVMEDPLKELAGAEEWLDGIAVSLGKKPRRQELSPELAEVLGVKEVGVYGPKVFARAYPPAII